MNEKKLKILQKKVDTERELNSALSLLETFETYKINQIPLLLKDIKDSIIKAKETINEFAKEVLGYE